MHTFLVLNPSVVAAWKVKSGGKGFEAKPGFRNSANKQAKDAATFCRGVGRWVPGWPWAALAVVGGEDM